MLSEGYTILYLYNEAFEIEYVDKINLNNRTKVRNPLHCTCKENNLNISWSTRMTEQHPS
jgi:hypothetical protein